jgi:hypothetical protein
MLDVFTDFKIFNDDHVSDAYSRCRMRNGRNSSVYRRAAQETKRVQRNVAAWLRRGAGRVCSGRRGKLDEGGSRVTSNANYTVTLYGFWKIRNTN